MKKSMKKLFIVFVLLITIFSIDYFIISNNIKHYEKEKELLNNNLVNQSKILFDFMVITRTWNAQHESVYVKNDKLEPNKYLANNQVKTENNETLIKINPAWMTQQISELANKNNGYFYKITSLNPINPNNKADAFEEEALRFFEKNRDVKYYYNLPKLENREKYFNFMGSLLVDEKCLNCHSSKEYIIGEVRGGIRVSVPLEMYKKTFENISESKIHNITIISIFSFISLVAILFSVLVFMRNQENIRTLNLSLRKKVSNKTEKLHDLNKNLELRVQEALQEAKESEKMMLSQAKNAAMGEMLSMIAHQWRQPLSEITMINNNLMVEVLFDSKDTEIMTKNIESSFEIVDHLSKTIDDFASFFKQTKAKEKFILVDMMNDIVEMLSNMLDLNKINVNIESKDKIEVFTYKRELLHVVLNMINNAKDAFIGNNIEKREIKIEILKDVDFVVINIYDNAGGIKKENLEFIFEPYFSTKSKNGTGIGLYMSKVIIEKHIGGKIAVVSDSNTTCFELKLWIENELS